MSSTALENVFLPHTLVTAANDLLQDKFPAYLWGFEQLLALEENTLVIPENYVSRNRFVSVPGEQLPKVVVLVPGIIGTPLKNGAGVYRATWRLGVGTMIAAKTEEDAIFLAEMYGTAVRAIFIDNPGINGVASRTTWLDESYDEIPIPSENQQFRAASVWFAVDVDNVVSKTQGPPEPGTVEVIHTANEVDIQIDRITG